MTLIGGMGTIFGPIAGAVFFTTRGELPRAARGRG